MPSPYTVAHATHQTLVAATVDKVTLTNTFLSAQNLAGIEVLHRGNISSPIYARIDGVNPTVAGDETSCVLSGGARVIGPITADQLAAWRAGTSPEVRLICAGAADYSVELVAL